MKDRAGLLLAIAAVWIANAAALAHVWSNRASSEPEVMLTERELPKAYQEQDNTGISFDLQRSQGLGFSTETWLDRSKLQDLGFDTNLAPDSDPGRVYYSHALPRPAFVALEFDGPAWQRYLADLAASPNRPEISNVEATLKQDMMNGSRLIAIDAAPDAAALRRRYPDATKVLIVRAKIGPNPYPNYRPGTTPGPGLTGRIEIREEINVPLPFSTQLKDIGGRPAGAEPRYQVHLRFGSLREPWVTGVDRLR